MVAPPVLGGDMKRRKFITLLGGAAAAWPLAVRAQQPGKLPIVGFMGPNTRSAASEWVAAFVQRLREHGWIDGRNIALEYRWVEDARSASPRSQLSWSGLKSLSLLHREPQQ